jgi:hypothetical protein
MPLSLSELTHIAETFAREHNPALTVVGVASTDPDTSRVELLVTVRGCHNDPCTLLLNLSRDDRNKFEAELGAQLREALRAHVALDDR